MQVPRGSQCGTKQACRSGFGRDAFQDLPINSRRNLRPLPALTAIWSATHAELEGLTVLLFGVIRQPT